MINQTLDCVRKCIRQCSLKEKKQVEYLYHRRRFIRLVYEVGSG